MGLVPEAFERMTPAEFIYAWLGWAKREGDRQRQAGEPTMQERMERIEEMKRCIRK